MSGQRDLACPCCKADCHEAILLLFGPVRNVCYVISYFFTWQYAHTLRAISICKKLFTVNVTSFMHSCSRQANDTVREVLPIIDKSQISLFPLVNFPGSNNSKLDLNYKYTPT